jgi:hypothetical protein
MPSHVLNRRRLEISALLGLTGCLLALAPACSTQQSDATHDSAAPDASPDAAITTGPIWTEESQAIDVTCSAYFLGSKRIRATRDQLSADQLGILSSLMLIPPQAYCYADSNACSVAITAADGTVATYHTEEFDSGCHTTTLVIPYASFSPFLESVPCLSAKQDLSGPADAGAHLPSVIPDPRCYNGVFAAPPGTVQRLLVVDDPSIPRHLELDSCNDTRRLPAAVHPQLLAPDRTTTLPAPWMTVTDPGADGTCFRLDYTFPAAGDYVLSIDIDAGFIDAGFTAGDFYLRFY